MSDLPALSRTIPPWLAVVTFEQAERLALLFSKDDTMPKHLVGKPGACFRVVTQATIWQVNPYTVAEASVPIGGRLTYSGAFIHALLLHLGVLAEPFAATFTGQANGLEISLRGIIKTTGEVKEVRGSVGMWRGESLAWSRIPEDMLRYHAARVWQKRYAPEVTIGLPGDAEEPAPPAPALGAPAPAPSLDPPPDPAGIEREAIESLELLARDVVERLGAPGENFMRALLKGCGVTHVRELTGARRGEFHSRCLRMLDGSRT